MDEKVKALLIKFLENNSRFSINKMQLELSIGFNRAWKISEYLKENNIINQESYIIVSKSEIEALDLKEFD